MSRLTEIIEDFIKIGYNYQLLHDKYVQEMEANKHSLAIQDSPGHEAQIKLQTLHSMVKNGDLPEKPVEVVKEKSSKKDK